VKIIIGSDHGGFEMKEHVLAHLRDQGHKVEDVGCYSMDSVDYPEIAEKVCVAVQGDADNLGILICGTGIGMSLAANRHRDIRAALCHEAYTAKMSREHNNANILCLGGRVLGVEVAIDIVRAWLKTSFAGGRHQRRIKMFS
jgi:ribose 5-phosphate isomerase B